MKARQSLLIDGQWQAGQGTAFTKLDPMTGDNLWQGEPRLRVRWR